MLNPQDIHKKAEEERQKEVSRRQKKKRGPKGKRFFVKLPESRSVFHRIYPHYPNSFLAYILPLMLFVIGFVLCYLDKKNFHIVMPWLWALPVLTVIIWLIYYIRESIDYSHYKNWRNDLGFPVHGWDQLGQSPKFPHWKFWDHNTILAVNVKPQTGNDTRRLLTDMLYLAAIEANKTFYAADFVQPGAAGDIRHKWRITGELEISGSANSSVMGELYLLIDKHLRAVQQQSGSIEAVTIQFSRDMLEVQPVQVSD